MEAPSSLLVKGEAVVVPPLSGVFSPNTFFHSLAVTFLFQGFKNYLLAQSPAQAAVPIPLASHTLTRSAYDSDLEVSCPTAPVPLWQIGKLLEAQIDGKPGALLVNGMANIFPCGDFTVWLYWYETFFQGRKGLWWGIDAEPRDSIFWFRGSRWFSASQTGL